MAQPAPVTGQKLNISTAAQLVASETLVAYGVVLKADPDNTTPVYFAFSEASATALLGFPIFPGSEEPIDRSFLARGDLRDIWVFAAAGTPDLYFYGG